MRALVLDRELSLHHDRPDPVRAAGESLVRVRMAGICGTDLELIDGYMDYRGIPGHEFVGEVADSADAGLIGRRIVGEINAGCGRCDFCIARLERHCANRTVLGILRRDGAFADYLVLPDANLKVVPERMPDELAVFVEPVAAAYEIFEQTHVAHNQRILVLGDGRLGALVAMVLWAEGYDVIVGGHHPEKLALLSGIGVQVQDEDKLRPGYEVVIDCTGRSAGINRSLALVRPRGKLILKSTAAMGAQMNLATAVVNEITIIGSRCGRFEPAIDAIANGKIDPRPLISAMYSLDDAPQAVAAARDREAFKILLKIS